MIPFLDSKPGGVGVWLAAERKWANRIFAAFAVVAIVLTVVGTVFRGPNWGWVWPWMR
jgi:hypothetical protein